MRISAAVQVDRNVSDPTRRPAQWFEHRNAVQIVRRVSPRPAVQVGLNVGQPTRRPAQSHVRFGGRSVVVPSYRNSYSSLRRRGLIRRRGRCADRMWPSLSLAVRYLIQGNRIAVNHN